MKSPITVLREMFGRQDPPQEWLQKFKFFFSRYSDIESTDYSRSIYALTKAIYYASTVKDKYQNGKEYGSKFLLGAVFGKPIINATAAFAFSKPPEVVVTSGTKAQIQETQDFLNGWLNDNKKNYFDVKRWALRDGDSYLHIRDDLSTYIIPAERVDLVTDPMTGKLTEIHVNNFVKEDEETIRYETVYTKVAPFVQLRKYHDKGFTVIGNEEEVDDDGERPFDIVDFHNEVDAGSIYGTTEFQNLYYLFANYHAVLENAIKNNIFNSNAIPYITGIDEISKFKEANGIRGADGDYKIDLGADSLLIGGKDFKISMVDGAKTADEASTLLKKLFYLIVDGAELPEFVFGAAVQSSRASVSEQMPVMVKKAERKQREQEVYDRKLIETVMYKGYKAGVCPVESADFNLVYPAVVDKDKKLNLEIVKVLSEEGVITDRTKLIMLEMGDYIEDVDDEIEKAKKENEEKREAYDAYDSPPKKEEKSEVKEPVKEMVVDEDIDYLSQIIVRDQRAEKIRELINVEV